MKEGIVAENIPVVDLKDMGYDYNNIDLVKFAEDRKQRALKVTDNLGQKVSVKEAYDFVAYKDNNYPIILVDGKVKYEILK